MKRLYLIFFLIWLWTCLWSSLESIAQTSYHWNANRGYKPFEYATDKGISINNQTDSIIYDYFKFSGESEFIRLSFRAKNNNGNPAKSYSYYTPNGKQHYVKFPSWGFFLTSLSDTIAVSVTQKEVHSGVESYPAAEIKTYDFRSRETQKFELKKGLNPYAGDNIWVVSNKNNVLDISAGDKGLTEVLSITGLRNNLTGIGFYAGWGSDILVSDINLDTSISQIGDSGSFDVDSLREYLKTSSDPLEGYWTLLDRELEESLVKMGGNYILACAKKDNVYYFIYLEGASVNKSNWKPGDVKAKFTPSTFECLYYVEWYDALKEPINKDIMAQKGDGDTLTIQFPYQSSKLRLRKFN